MCRKMTLTDVSFLLLFSAAGLKWLQIPSRCQKMRCPTRIASIVLLIVLVAFLRSFNCNDDVIIKVERCKGYTSLNYNYTLDDNFWLINFTDNIANSHSPALIKIRHKRTHNLT